MDPLVSTLVVILLSLVGARFSFSTEITAPGPRLLFRTGTHFLLLGLLLGPQALGLLSLQSLEQLFPLTALGLGWVGFLFGLQLDRNTLRQFSRKLHVVAYGQGLLAFGVFAGMAWMGLRAFGVAERPWTIMAWAAAATACVSAPAGIAMISSNYLVRGPVRNLLFFVSSVDAIVGIIALQLIYAVYHSPGSFPSIGEVSPLFWVATAVGLGVLCGIIFLWLTRFRPSAEELVLYLMGSSAFAAAAALRLHVSPLFVCVIMGAVVANLSRDHRRVFAAVHAWEKPIYLVLLILAGALLDVTNPLIWPLALGYVVVRAVAKFSGAWVATKLARLEFRTPESIGSGLLPQSGISIALALSVLLTFYEPKLPSAPAGRVLFAVVVLGVVVSELVGPYFTTRVLRLAGEISPAVVRAIELGDNTSAAAAAIRHVPDPVRAGAVEERDDPSPATGTTHPSDLP
jgi:sodium/hydrogen exchanger family protein